MKYIIVLFMLIGCSFEPRFKVGDCIRRKGFDDFDESTATYQILNVGVYSYKIQKTKYVGTSLDIGIYIAGYEDSSKFDVYAGQYERVQCPIKQEKCK